MAKYRSLTKQELESMEKEFIDFLVLNGITGEDWVKIKEETPERALGICDAFSDVVFTKILKQIRYLERHTPKEVISVFCDAQQMYLLGIEAPDDSNIDFTNSADFEQLKSNPPPGLTAVKSEKKYTKNREDELWSMMESGFFISNQKLYMSLFSAHSTS